MRPARKDWRVSRFRGRALKRRLQQSHRHSAEFITFATVDTLSIDSSTLLLKSRPTSVAEVCAMVKRARESRQGIYPAGGRTTLDVGWPPPKPGTALETTALNAVIDYPARDMTITVQGGITLAALRGALAKEGQWLPIDVALPEQATLGGAIAFNKSGPRRYGYGTLRDYVIGISFVTDDGVEVKAGGRVVKNVAGYDLMKLQIGAAGTLGVVTQVTLKVKPRPEASAAVAFGCSGESLGLFLDLLHASKSRPVAVELLSPAAWRAAGVNLPFSDPWTIAVGFEEKAATVKWQLATLRDEVKSAPIRDLAEVPDPVSLWSAITALQIRPESQTIARTSVLPSQLPDAVTRTGGQLIHAHALNGVIWQHDPESVPPTAVIRRSPTGTSNSRPIGRETTAWELMRTVKQTLDPDDVFNPGRLFSNL